ncbi:hypothetical protein FOA52_009499 [Chlamydomonas sp. UWO 241]|nr:hypothetical protein FOA52_009499 [Chlamydomonas sp. UWO 241]
MATHAIPEGFVIVGGGRVGLALEEMAAGKAVLVKRGEPVAGPPGPIIIATRNDDLQAIVDATPADRKSDLVFIQNGMLQPWLDKVGLGDNTQVLVYFAVAKKGEKPTDGKTDVNPEGLTAANGKHAQAMADLLASGGLSCKVLDKADYSKSMLEKLIWISALMLVGAKHKVTVGEVESKHTEEVSTLITEMTAAGRAELITHTHTQVSALITEMAAAGSAELGITLDDGVVARLLAYARSVAHFPTAVKEFPWRNGWFHAISAAKIASGAADPMPRHTALLKEVGAM